MTASQPSGLMSHADRHKCQQARRSCVIQGQRLLTNTENIRRPESTHIPHPDYWRHFIELYTDIWQLLTASLWQMKKPIPSFRSACSATTHTHTHKIL